MCGLLSAIGLAFLLVGCPDATEAQKLSAYSSCIMAAVARLDDGKSDPESMARVVSGQCSVQYRAITGGYITENAEAYMRDRIRDKELYRASSAVLTYRTAHKQRCLHPDSAGAPPSC